MCGQLTQSSLDICVSLTVKPCCLTSPPNRQPGPQELEPDSALLQGGSEPIELIPSNQNQLYHSCLNDHPLTNPSLGSSWFSSLHLCVGRHLKRDICWPGLVSMGDRGHSAAISTCHLPLPVSITWSPCSTSARNAATVQPVACRATTAHTEVTQHILCLAFVLHSFAALLSRRMFTFFCSPAVYVYKQTDECLKSDSKTWYEMAWKYFKNKSI